MNPLSTIISLLRPHAVLSKPISGRGKWGVRYDAYESPSFCIVLAGKCWLTLKGMPPRLLEEGDFLLLPATPPFLLSSHPGVSYTTGRPSASGVRHGEPKGTPDFRMLGGAFQIDPVNVGLLFEFLPEMIHIRAADADTTRLARVIELIMDECRTEMAGREIVLERLMEIILVEVLRWRSSGQDVVPAGLLAGLRDPAIARALRAMHADVRHRWTVVTLAKHARMSRSGFSSRFTETVGCAPMEYLSRWRMSLAQDALSRGGVSLSELADEIGYESASAFSSAFHRRVGCAPGAFAKGQR